jgi:hypothetical protein
LNFFQISWVYPEFDGKDSGSLSQTAAQARRKQRFLEKLPKNF